MTDRLLALDAARKSVNPPDPRVVALLADPATEQRGLVVATTVRQTSSLWTVRWEINRDTDHPLLGAEELLKTLALRVPQRQVRQLSFVGNRSICTVFLDWTSGEFLGSILGRRRSEEEEQSRKDSFAKRYGAAQSETGQAELTAGRSRR